MIGDLYRASEVATAQKKGRRNEAAFQSFLV